MADACLCKGIGIARTSKAKIEGISHAGSIDTGNIWFPICRSTATNVFKRFQTHETKRFEFKTHYGIPTWTKTLSREKRKSAQPSKPRPPHEWKCRTGAWLPPVRFHGSFTPSRPPAGSLAPRFTAAQPATPSVKTAVILHPPPAASSATRKNVSRTTNNHTIYQHNKQTC